MINVDHIDPEDLALYAMQLLNGDEASVIEAHLGKCTECRHEYQAVQNDLALVALTVEQHEVPAPARERFMQQVSREKRVVPIDRPAIDRPANDRSADLVEQKSVSKSQSKLLPWLGWAVAAGVSLSAFNLYHERAQLQAAIADQSAQLGTQSQKLTTISKDAARAQAIMDALTDSSAMRVTLNTSPTAKPAPQGRATYVASKGTLIFVANNLDPLPTAKVYELWLIPADGTSPIAAGTFHPDARGNASLILPKLRKGVAAKAFGVTVEAEGGAAKPTLPIILAGAQA